jgi:LmbE family N-acetylglucosaminyl deacetylase
VRWVVLSAEGKRRAGAKAAAQIFLRGARRFQVTIKSFRTSYFPSQFVQIKNWIETLKAFRPDVVFTHFRNDRHQHHRIVSELTWNTFRDHLILEYEIPKYDGDLGRPNLYVPMAAEVSQQKIATLAGILGRKRRNIGLIAKRSKV